MKIESIRNVVEELKGKVNNLPSSNSAKEKGDLYGSYFDKVGILLSEETKIGTADSSYKEYLSVYQRFAKTSQEISEREEKRDASGLVLLYEGYFNQLGRELETIANAAISGTIGGAAGYIIPKTIEVYKGQQGEHLREAAFDGDIRAIKVLVEQGADVNDKDNEYGWAPLNFAAWNGHADAIKVLADFGADVNTKTNAGWTPLHDSANNGHVEAIKVLVDLGADVNAKSNNGHTPLNLAARHGRAEAIKVLREFGGI